VGAKVLEKLGEVRLASAPDEDAIIQDLGDIDGCVVRARCGLTRRMLQSAPNLKVAGRHGVGVDNIDLVACTEHGVQVVNTPMATVEPVAEHAVGLMVALSKRLAFADRHLRQGSFTIKFQIQGREMRGRTLGVIGFGRIGRRVAEICHNGFGMNILYSDVVSAPDVEAALGAKKVAMDELLQTAEYITVHVPLLPATTGLIGEREFGLMRLEAMFFNTSRGPVVDEAALCHALDAGQIRAAGVDVFEQEPTDPENPLFGMDNIIVTPHIASATEEALVAMSLVAEDIVAVLQGRAPKYPVNKLA